MAARWQGTIALLLLIIISYVDRVNISVMILNPEFAAIAAGPMVLLCWGVLCNSLAQFPFSYLQSMGKVRQIALLHLFELPLYFMALPWFLDRWGILGAAIAWLVRVAFDLVALLALSAIMLFSSNRQRDD